MSSHWYLIAALPYLRFGETPALGADAFRAFCADQLPEGELQAVDGLLAGHPSETGPAACWHDIETQMLNAVARIRARTYNATPAMRTHRGFQVAIEEGVADAFARDNPLERETDLDRLRWRLADELAAGDSFGFPAVLAYAVKLRIAERHAALDEETGRKKVEELVLAAAAAEASQMATDNR